MSAISTITGALKVTGQQDLAAAVLAVSSILGNVSESAQEPVSASLTATSSVTANLTQGKTLSGSVAATTVVTAGLTEKDRLTAAVSGASTITGAASIKHSLIHTIPYSGTYDFGADPHCVSLYNAETWHTYLDDQKGTNHLVCTPQLVTDDFKQGDGCMELSVISPRTASGVAYSNDSLGSGWPGKSGTLNKTVSAVFWMKSHTTSGGSLDTVIQKHRAWFVFLWGGQIYWCPDGGVTHYVVHPTHFTEDVWYHVGVTFDNSDRSYRIRVYDTSTNSNWVDKVGIFGYNMVTSAYDFKIGYGNSYVESQNFDGLLDDLAVFNDVLTPGEIDNCRTATHNYSTDGNCVARWRFDSQDFLTDDIGNLSPYYCGVPLVDRTVYRMGTASMKFNGNDYQGAFINDASLSSNTPYKAGTTNLDCGLSFWFRARTLPAVLTKNLITKRVNDYTGSVGVTIASSGGGWKIRLSVRYGLYLEDYYYHGTDLVTGRWYHAIVNIDATNNLYLINLWDDVLETTVEVSGPLLHDPLVSDYPWILGASQLNTSAGAFDGWLDEVAIFDAPLNTATITDIRLETQADILSTVSGKINETHSLSARVSAVSTVTGTNLGTESQEVFAATETILTYPPPVPVPWNYNEEKVASGQQLQGQLNDLVSWGNEIAKYTEEELIKIHKNLYGITNSVGTVVSVVLTPSRLVGTRPDGTLVSTDLSGWIAGTGSEIEVTDDGDGSVTIGLVDPLIVGKGGTGAASLTDHGILLGSGASAITPLGAATNGQIPIGSTGADPVLAAITGTANQVMVTLGAGTIALSGPQDLATSSSPRFAKVEVDDAATYIDKDGSGNMTFTDAVTGTRTLKQIGCPTYRFIKATGQAEGDLHLSDATNWAVSKALIHCIRVITASTNWDMYLLQNDNGYAANDANIPMLQIAKTVVGNANLMLGIPYQDEDASGEVHLYWVSSSGVDTATIIIQGYELT